MRLIKRKTNKIDLACCVQREQKQISKKNKTTKQKEISFKIE